MTDLWAGKSAHPAPPRPPQEGDDLWAGRGERRPSRLGPGRRTQLVARVVLVALLIGTPVVLGSVALDLFTVRGSLQDTQAALGGLRTSLAEVDLEGGEARLITAREGIEDASRRSGRVTWSIAARAPVIGSSVAVTREVVEVAASAVEVASVAVAEGRELVGDGVELEVVDGQADLEPILRAQDVLATLPTERLVAARDALSTPREGWLPTAIRDGRQDVLALADETVGTIEAGEALTAALPPFLGVGEARSYFVGLQTSAELRGSGGLIGYWGVLSVDEGRVRFGDTEDYDAFDDTGAPEGEPRTSRVGTIGLSMTNPPEVDPAYYARYGFAAGARSFPNVNLDPDLPTTAKAILDLFALQTGQRLDGVILLDPIGLEALLGSTGPSLPLPEDLQATLGLEQELPVDGFARFVTVDLYETLGFGRSEERKDALRRIGDAAFDEIFDGRWESGAMARAVVQAAAERHLQVFTSDDAVQDAFRDVGVTGDLVAPPGVDLFALTANNVIGGKQDVHLGYETTLDIALDDVRRGEDGELTAARGVEFTATVDNPLPTSGMDTYIIGSCYLPERVNRCFEGNPGENRTWFSFWSSPLLQVDGFESDDGTRPNALGATFRDLRVVDHLQLTPPQSRSSFGLTGEGRVALRRTAGSVAYEFRWWRQSKASPDLLDVRVSPPAGWAIVDIEVIGGGSGRGMGVHGEGEELVAEVAGGVARLRGTVTADTRLIVHLGAPGGGPPSAAEAVTAR
jgi:hypothetical protein